MNMFEMNGGVAPESAAEQRRRETEAEIQAVFAEIREPINVENEIKEVKSQLIREEDDAARHTLSIRLAALTKYKKTLEVPAPDALLGSNDAIRDLSEVQQQSHDRSGVYQLPNEDRPVVQSLRYRRSAPPKRNNSEATMNFALEVPRNSETYIHENDQMAE